jgi:hypothetical protein
MLITFNHHNGSCEMRSDNNFSEIFKIRRGVHKNGQNEESGHMGKHSYLLQDTDTNLQTELVGTF